MSEYQFVAFRAVDRPVSKTDLEFMRNQSSRADISAWHFENEYQYGDFRGNALEMLRRGYDFHLHYANFGMRTLMIRLPHGLPNPAAARGYVDKESLRFVKDKTGPGGTISISPYYDAGGLNEVYNLGELVDALLPLRAEIIDGDLRPLYLAHLAVAGDDNHDPEQTLEAAVPAGLDSLSDAQQALAEFYGLSAAIIAATAQKSPATKERPDPENQYSEWIRGLPTAVKDDWLERILSDAEAPVRAEILAQFRDSRGAPDWPAAPGSRTMAELRTTEEQIQREFDRRSAEKAVRARAKKLKEMASNPARTLQKTEELMQYRSRATYEEIAELLADLEKSLAGSAQSGLAKQQAEKLRSEHPTLRILIAKLRDKGLLQK